MRFVPFLFLFLALLSINVIADMANYTNYSTFFVDNYTFDDSTDSDGIAWGGNNLEVYTSRDYLHTNADCICWSWCDNQVSENNVSNYPNWNKCYCTNTAAKDTCSNPSTGGLDSEEIEYYTLLQNIKNNNASVISTTFGTNAFNFHHTLETGNGSTDYDCRVDLLEYVDCDDSQNARRVHVHEHVAGQNDGNLYFVMSAKQYICEGGSSKEYAIWGRHDTAPPPGSTANYSSWQAYNCSTTQICNQDVEVHPVFVDQTLVYTPYAQLPSPCVENLICNGTIEVNVADNSGNVLPSQVTVKMNDVAIGQTDSTLGQIRLNATNVACNSFQDVEIVCSNNISCGLKSTQIDLNGDVDYLNFDCTKCLSSKDISISQEKIYTYVDQGTLIVTVTSRGISGPVNVSVSRQTEQGLIAETKTVLQTVNADTETNFTFPMSVPYTNFLHFYLDQNNTIKNEDETNNYVFRPASKRINATVIFKTTESYLNSIYKEYLNLFVNVIDNETNSEMIIQIGNPYTLNQNAGITNISLNGYPHEGIITIEKNNKKYVNIIGNGIEGQIAALKKFGSARIYLIETPPPGGAIYIDKYDRLALSVLDLMQRNETSSCYLKNGTCFIANVRKILFDNSFDVAILPVKTLNTTSYNRSITLRVKHVNSDFSTSYRDSIGISDIPVVFSGGIFSNLMTWEYQKKGSELTRTGLATKMVNEGYDVWEVEMNGGPETDCIEKNEDDCPDYTFNDIVDHHWPALIGGVQEYSGKNKVNYVGDSHGAHAALIALNRYSLQGKNNSGFIFNYGEGVYQYSDLSSNPVGKFFALEAPATLFEDTITTETIRKTESPIDCEEFGGDYCYSAGNNTLDSLKSFKHVRFIDVARELAEIDAFNVHLWLLMDEETNSEGKISYSLLKYYIEMILDNTNSINLENLSVDKLILINSAGILTLEGIKFEDDGLVHLNDRERIANSTSQISPENKVIVTKNLIYHGKFNNDESLHEDVSELIK